MIPRIAIIVLGLAASSVHADLPVAPFPREVRPDGTRVQAPLPEPAATEDPAAIVERIIANSKDAGERLGQTDTGTETQKKQATVLKDIDTLLNQQDNSGGGGGSDKSKDMNPDPKKNESDSKKNDMSKGGMDDQPKKDQQPMNGNDPQPKDDRRPRDPSGKQPKDKTQAPDAGKKPDDKSDAKNDPMPSAKSDEPKDPKKDAPPTGGVPMGKSSNHPSLPLDEDVAKKVWGGPREQMRKQVDQYYNERFMPGYSGLLKAYYSHLAAEGAKK